jgi:hypothetical protein
MRGALALGLVCLGLLCVAPAVPAAPPGVPGKRYDGKSATGQRNFVRLSGDGKRLTDYDFFVRTRCSDGRRRIQGLIAAGEPRTAVDPSGSFSFSGRRGRLSYPARGGRVSGRATIAVTASFSGDTLSGTIRARFRSRRFNCSSGPVAFTLARDGTPGAPFRDAKVATGRYSARGRRIKIGQLRVLAPGRELTKMSFSWRARCRVGSISGTDTYGRFKLNGSSLTIAGRRRNTYRPVRARERYRLKLRFFRSGGTYRVRGEWRITSRLFRRGRQVDTCSGRFPFKGTFRSGPTSG